MFKFTRNCMYSMHSMYLILIFQNTDRIMMPIKCDLCDQNATEKHHVTYYPERTIPVCAFHGDDIHQRPSIYSNLLQYGKSDSTEFYTQQKRIGMFLKQMAYEKRKYWKR